MSTASKSLRIADSISSEPYTIPGMYPRFAILSDGECLCHKCCETERKWIGTTTGSDGWTVVSDAINWEDSELYCGHCGAQIESAYA